MSFLNELFGSSRNKEDNQKFWHRMESVHDLEGAIEVSHRQKVVVFKHSTRCFISKTVLHRFENEVENTDKSAAYYLLDLLAHRELSNKMAEVFGVEHQSPQLIVVENGKAVSSASHEAISIEII